MFYYSVCMYVYKILLPYFYYNSFNVQNYNHLNLRFSVYFYILFNREQCN